MQSNLGMYRVQLAGDSYAARPRGRPALPDPPRHRRAPRGGDSRAAQPLRVNVFVGGPPAMTLAAVMPLPEGLSRAVVRRCAGRPSRAPVSASRTARVADARRRGLLLWWARSIRDVRKPEGPFGDHLGYYSLAHDFPVLRVEQVYHRPDAIWPFTVVGRPPQEDTTFGELIHELTGPVIPTVLPGGQGGARGRRHRRASAAAGHRQRALRALSRRAPSRRSCSRRPTPSWARASCRWPSTCSSWPAKTRPVSTCTTSRAFLRHVLERVDLGRDLHFQTRTTIDTLDYSGGGLNQGSKLVMAAVGEPRRTLGTAVPRGSGACPTASPIRGSVCRASCACAAAPHAPGPDGLATDVARAAASWDKPARRWRAFPWWCWSTTASSSRNRSTTFSGSPSRGRTRRSTSHGVGAAVVHKHWGCRGPAGDRRARQIAPRPALDRRPRGDGAGRSVVRARGCPGGTGGAAGLRITRSIGPGRCKSRSWTSPIGCPTFESPGTARPGDVAVGRLAPGRADRHRHWGWCWGGCRAGCSSRSRGGPRRAGTIGCW